MKKVEQIELLWEDKKRYFGLPISFTKYSLSKERIFRNMGLFITRYDQIMLFRITDVRVSVSLWQRLFGVGTVILISKDDSQPILKIHNVRFPLYVKERIHMRVQEVRDELGIKPTEFI